MADIKIVELVIQHLWHQLNKSLSHGISIEICVHPEKQLKELSIFECAYKEGLESGGCCLGSGK